MIRANMAPLLAALLLGATPVLAEDTSNAADAVSAVEDAEDDAASSAVEDAEDDEVSSDDSDSETVEESAILPSADEHEESKAPSMEVDCEKDPASCVEPLDGPSEGPVQSSVDDDPATDADEEEGAAKVTAEP